jgi:hypothetical protein
MAGISYLFFFRRRRISRTGVSPWPKIQAWAWFSVAAGRGFRDAAQRRDALGTRLSTAEMEQAKRLRHQRLPRQ